MHRGSPGTVRAGSRRERRRNPSLQEDMMNRIGRSMKQKVSNRIAGQIVRGLLGGLFGSRR